MRVKRIVGVGIVATVLCVATVVAVLRWNIWFGNPVEPEYMTSDAPTHVLLTFGKNADSRHISWQCDTVLQPAYIEYWMTDGDTCRVEAEGELFVSGGGKSVFYRGEIAVTNIGRYFYRVCHPEVVSDAYAFEVRDAVREGVSFIYMGDIQDTIGGITGRVTREIVEAYPETDFYVLGGDLIHRPMEIYWNEAFEGIGAFASTYPTCAVSGNHEYYKGLNKKAEARFPLHFVNYIDCYNENGYCFDTLRYGDVELFLIDSNSNLLRLLKQREAMKKALSQSTARWKVAVLHHPPYSIRRKYNNADVRWLFVPLFEHYGVDLVLSGHEHGYARRHTDGNTSPVYTISHCSPKQYTHHYTEAECYGTGDRYYQRITVQGDTLQMNTYTIAHELYDSVVITKRDGHSVIKK